MLVMLMRMGVLMRMLDRNMLWRKTDPKTAKHTFV